MKISSALMCQVQQGRFRYHESFGINRLSGLYNKQQPVAIGFAVKNCGRMWHRSQFNLRLSFNASVSYEGGKSELQ
jgi:hypothetical protein